MEQALGHRTSNEVLKTPLNDLAASRSAFVGGRLGSRVLCSLSAAFWFAGAMNFLRSAIGRRLTSRSVAGGVLIATTAMGSAAIHCDGDTLTKTSAADLEARAAALGRNLRCHVCANQTVQESDADVAKYFQGLIRQMLREGKSEDDIKDYLLDRYSQFLSYAPAVDLFSVVKYSLPLFGAIAVLAMLRMRTGMGQLRQTAAKLVGDLPLTSAELDAYAKLLKVPKK